MKIQWHANLIKKKHFEEQRRNLLNVRCRTAEMMIIIIKLSTRTDKPYRLVFKEV